MVATENHKQITIKLKTNLGKHELETSYLHSDP